MSGSYVLMDGGIRDARAGWEPDARVLDELQRHIAAAQSARAKLQPLIDER